MYCINCGTQNEGTAKFCRSCGASLAQGKSKPVTVEQKSGAYKFWNVMFWIGIVVTAYCLLTLVAPLTDTEYWYDINTSSFVPHTVYRDLTGIYRDSGIRYLYEEWGVGMVVSAICTIMFFWFRSVAKRKMTSR